MAKRILVVDDDQDLVEVLKTTLTKAGYRVLTAYDGEEALERIRKVIPDLIVLDVVMPKTDGIEVLKGLTRMKNLNRRLATPVILLTAKSEKKNVHQGYEFGADWYLAKPFQAPDLLAAVKSLLSGK
ncbi:MAG: response regulator [Candidatus Omnitrophica bacterium]|nr:response regulator [Candidatus Omnitrophota bacterium]